MQIIPNTTDLKVVVLTRGLFHRRSKFQIKKNWEDIIAWTVEHDDDEGKFYFTPVSTVEWQLNRLMDVWLLVNPEGQGVIRSKSDITPFDNFKEAHELVMELLDKYASQS
jgi:hypothetical protein